MGFSALPNCTGRRLENVRDEDILLSQKGAVQGNSTDEQCHEDRCEDEGEEGRKGVRELHTGSNR